MTPNSADRPAAIDHGTDEARGYEAPTITVLGTVAELTQGDTANTDELFNDGSQI